MKPLTVDYPGQSIVHGTAKNILRVIAINFNNYAATGDRLDIVNLNEYVNLLCHELRQWTPESVEDWDWQDAYMDYVTERKTTAAPGHWPATRFRIGLGWSPENAADWNVGDWDWEEAYEDYVTGRELRSRIGLGW